MRIAEALLDLLAPPRCPSCGAAAAQVWCPACLEDLSALALADGRPVDLGERIRAAAAYAYAGVVRDTVLAVKVRGQHAALDAMGSLLRARLGLPPPGVGLAHTWVPASRDGLRRRGVDVARRLAGPHAVELLQRVSDAPEQKRLDARERRRAVRGAFAPTGRVTGAVVVIDDVRTSGATALAAGQALRAAGADRVLVATFAAADEHSDQSAARSRAARLAGPAPSAGAGGSRG